MSIATPRHWYPSGDVILRPHACSADVTAAFTVGPLPAERPLLELREEYLPEALPVERLSCFTAETCFQLELCWFETSPPFAGSNEANFLPFDGSL